MRSIHPFLSDSFYRKLYLIENDIIGLNESLLISISDELLFANTGRKNRAYKSKSQEISDESGLGSGAGITSDNQSALANRHSTADDTSSATDDAGATGPGSDRLGDKMPGEDGITSLTDGIARFIEDAEDDGSEKGSRKK